MRTLQLVLIGVVVIVLIIAIGSYYNDVETQKRYDHQNYCHNWKMDLNQQEEQLNADPNSDPTAYNNAINQYNRECIF